MELSTFRDLLKPEGQKALKAAVSLNPTEEQFRAFVLAGQAIVFSLQGKTEQATDKLASVDSFVE